MALTLEYVLKHCAYHATEDDTERAEERGKQNTVK